MSVLTNKISLMPVNDILDFNFFIPSYQRGYRWTSNEVKALLDDIYEFILDNEKSDKSVFYCLQPLIAYLHNDKFYVIDGQQRLTTIYIILTYLKDIAQMLGKSKYQLSYETRPDSEIYLNNIDGVTSNDNVDYFHIYHAYNAVSEWFSDKDGILKVKMLSTLTASNVEGKNVKFIWYEIDPKDAIDVFTRINIGKIPLTNAELIKALFVKDKNFSENEQAKKIAITTEWDDIEKKLNNPKFWYFLSNLNHNSNYDNKIEYILDLISNKSKENEKLHTFFYFNNLIESAKVNFSFDIDNVWIKIKDKFQILEEWYESHDLYHYVGYLLSTGTSINDILEWSQNKDKSDFIKFIESRIRLQFKNVDIDKLTFERSSDKRIIRRILLLFNLETILQSKKSHIRFPFDKYKTEKWDIEHINPQNPFDKIEHYVEWCLDSLEYLTGETFTVLDLQKDQDFFEEKYEVMIINLSDDDKKVIDLIIDILNDPIDFKPKTEELAFQLFNRFKGAESDSPNHISNLTLLDAVTNRSYGNSLFPIKRNTIIKNDCSGVFVPICTKNVFLKYYSKKMSDVMFWKEADGKAYFENIKDTLSQYLMINN